MNTKKEYKHFLCYDQSCFDGIAYGQTHLYFDFDHTTMYIKEVDYRTGKIVELDFPLPSEEANIISELKGFLLAILEDNNFEGDPEFVESRIFTKQSFESMQAQAKRNRKEKYDLAVKSAENNDLLNYFRSIQITPEPASMDGHSWRANCLSGGQHSLMISTTSNTWGCGYCRKKGDIHALRQWYESKNKIVS